MDRKDKVMGIIGLIALRKSELYYRVISELSKDKLPSKESKEKVKRYISEMENERLLSAIEKRNKKINPNSGLKDLELDINHIVKEAKNL